MYKVIETKMGEKKLTIETGKLAKQADGAVVMSFGDTKVIVTAVSSKEQREGLNFFPLTVDYVEKYYASGKIPGGYLKREARPSDLATLTSRLIDRPIRPLFPDNYKYETQIIATVLSYDADHTAEQISLIGASAALMISDIPFSGPIAACRVGRVDGKLIAAPRAEELEKSDLDILVASSDKAVVMVEGSANAISENDVLEAIMFAFEAVQPAIKAQMQLVKELGKTKRICKELPKDEKLEKMISQYCTPKFAHAYSIKERIERYKALDDIKNGLEEVLANYLQEQSENFEKIFNSDEKLFKLIANNTLEELEYEYARNLIIKDGARIDGRSFTEVRPITCEIGILPRTHGSSIFTRGETQVLATVTLGSADDEQFVDSLEGLTKDKFILHYNFPPFCVGEARGLRGPGRREIGHGALAKRAVSAILPDFTDFPYTIRVVSEVLESNGSSSMASVCSACMALMDAGVPVKETVAGVAMGLIVDEKTNKFSILTDILGDEDHLGDMDFKVVGTKHGVTAIQMDIKIAGVTKEILAQALEQAREAKLHIIKEMEKEIATHRSELSDFAPRIESMTINTEYIRDVIGPGGKVIKAITEKTGAKININDSGEIHIVSYDKEGLMQAKNIILGITSEPEEGTIFDAVVKKITDFGAFVEYLPGKEGLVHVSEIAEERVNKVTDYLSEGQSCQVMYLGSDRQGRVKLSIKAIKKNK